MGNDPRTTYEIIDQLDGSCAVEIRRPGGSESVSGFAGRAEAAAWIAKQKTPAAPGRGAHHQRYTRTAEQREDRGPPRGWRR